MEDKKVYTAIGLMSGTSLDGIDVALIKTNGTSFIEQIDSMSIPYDEEIKDKLKEALGAKEDIDGSITRTEIELTRAHAAAVDWLLSRTGYNPKDIDLIGFHGHTIYHDPEEGFTWQIGNGAMLARLTGINVVNDMRSADVAAGGQGAPFLPLYHQALMSEMKKPVVIVNIGGVSNVTYLGENDEIIAFDTGPGNALLDDWVNEHLDRSYDEDGLLARQGQIDPDILQKCLEHSYFDKAPPKSLDRDQWDTSIYQNLNAADGAATLTAFTVKAIAKAENFFPETPAAWYITGGGRLNKFMMEQLQKNLSAPVKNIDELGKDGDSIEAEGFAYLAVRSHLNLPLSFPSTTGVKEPITGGVFYERQPFHS